VKLSVEVAVRKIFEAADCGGLAQALREDHGERIERTAELLLQVSSSLDEEAMKRLVKGRYGPSVASQARTTVGRESERSRHQNCVAFLCAAAPVVS
jgi:hypothetical protein